MHACRRRGIALFGALALMGVIALLIAGAAATATLAQRTSRLAQVEVSLTTAADYAVATVLGDARRLDLADLPLGRSMSTDIAIPGSVDLRVRVAVTRLPHGVLWMVADAFLASGDLGHRRVNLVARFPSVGPRPPAGIVARGSAELGTNVVVVSDTSGDPECAPNAGVAVMAAPGADVTGIDSGLVAISVVALDSATYYLTSRQQTLLRDGGRFTHVAGDTTIAGGSFDGILIVDGNLTVLGPFTAAGLIVARGRIEATAGAFSVTGAVMSYAPKDFGAPTIKFSGVTIRYSPCVVDRALRRALLPHPVVERSWAELF